MSATADRDYEDDDLDYVIPSGESDTTVCECLPIKDDFEVEGTECLDVELGPSGNTPSDVVFLSPNNASVCIQDDDVGE